MAYRPLEINVVSAKDLKNVNLISKMDVYVVVSLFGDESLRNKKQKAKSFVDRSGGSNPNWNFPVKFTVDDSLAQQNRLSLVFKIKCDSILGDKDVGEVSVPVQELLDSPGDGKSMRFVSYQVRKPSGKPKGELHFSYKFGDKVAGPPVPMKGDEPVMAYPATVAGSSSASHGGHAPYPPAPQGYSYPPPPPPQGYAYPPPPPDKGSAAYGAYPPPPQGGYGYPRPGYGYPGQAGYGYPPVQQPPKKNKFGAGLGAGLLGGMLGGLILGDIVSDAADCDFDGGFDF